MSQNPLILESERFECAYLRLFFRRQTVHRGNHRQHGNQQKQNGHNGTHGFALFRFALLRRIRGVLVFGQHKKRLVKRSVYLFRHFFFRKGRKNVYLRIKRHLCRFFVHNGGDICKPVSIVIGHKL